jgi:4-aminobutyrate aminotransferase/(S)-3-amino-2-methylpropionate transaminase
MAAIDLPDAARANAVLRHALDESRVLLLSCGTYGNVIRFLPPLSISDDLLVEGLQVVASQLAAS